MEEQFTIALNQAVSKQLSLERTILRLQDFDTNAENLWKVLDEVEATISPVVTDSSDDKLRENIEQCQVSCRWGYAVFGIQLKL